MYELPRIESFPETLFQHTSLNEVFHELGFVRDTTGTPGKLYGNTMLNFTVKAFNTELQWIMTFQSFTLNGKRSLADQDDIGIISDLAAIEILSIIYREWASHFGKNYIPCDLIYGQHYLEHIQMLKESRPPKPIISVDRETFRFAISKIKRDQDIASGDYDIELSFRDGQLRIAAKSTVLFVPTLVCKNISTEKIYVSARELNNNIPKRFTGYGVQINIVRDKLTIGRTMKARWEGPDLWEHNEYDNFLNNRLLRRSIIYLGYYRG